VAQQGVAHAHKAPARYGGRVLAAVQNIENKQAEANAWQTAGSTKSLRRVTQEVTETTTQVVVPVPVDPFAPAPGESRDTPATTTVVTVKKTIRPSPAVAALGGFKLKPSESFKSSVLPRTDSTLEEGKAKAPPPLPKADSTTEGKAKPALSKADSTTEGKAKAPPPLPRGASTVQAQTAQAGASPSSPKSDNEEPAKTTKRPPKLPQKKAEPDVTERTSESTASPKSPPPLPQKTADTSSLPENTDDPAPEEVAKKPPRKPKKTADADVAKASPDVTPEEPKPSKPARDSLVVVETVVDPARNSQVATETKVEQAEETPKQKPKGAPPKSRAQIALTEDSQAPTLQQSPSLSSTDVESVLSSEASVPAAQARPAKPPKLARQKES